MREPPQFLVQVTTPAWTKSPSFCAGTIWSGPWCIEAAPILRWALGMRWEKFERYCKRRRWKLHVHAIEKPTCVAKPGD